MIAAALVLALAPASPPLPRDPARQFDFWVGEWSVQNRHWNAAGPGGGAWREGDVTRARVTPVCGGAAILEEWAGAFRGGEMNGFSLRAWDPDRERWALLLFWTMDGSGGFGQLEGSFRHGRGEFFSSWTDAEGAGVEQRYTFSDALPDSVRWDSALTRDGGQTWHTDWIMEFSRTRAAAQTTQDRLFEVEWTEGELSPHPEARRLDWMLGTWTGTHLVAELTFEAQLRCKTIDRDCLVLDLLEHRATSSDAWIGRLGGARLRVAAWTLGELGARRRRHPPAPAPREPRRGLRSLRVPGPRHGAPLARDVDARGAQSHDDRALGAAEGRAGVRHLDSHRARAVRVSLRP